MKNMVFACMGLVALAAHGAFGAGELDHAYLVGTTDKNPFSYKVGEEVTFTLHFEGAKPFAEGDYVLDWDRVGDDGVRARGKEPLVWNRPVRLKTVIGTNGFVYCRAYVCTRTGERYRRILADADTTPEGKKALNKWEKKGASIDFQGAAVAEPEKLQSVPEPADYDAFWARHKATLAAVPMKADVKEHPSPTPAARVFSFSIACAGPRPVTGTLTVPTKPGRHPAQISFHGYGTDYVQKPQAYPWHTDRLYMFINAHGYELGREASYYTEFYKSTMSNGHTFACDPAENADPETAYFSGMTYRIMRALEYLKTRPEWDGRNLTAEGGSMGGLQAIWAGALDPDVSKVSVYVPWCCDAGGRDTLRHYTESSLREAPGLRYYDPVNMARRIPEKTFVDVTRAGFGDMSSTPSGVMIFWNNLKCKRSIRWVQGSTHGEEPPEEFREEYVWRAGGAEAQAGVVDETYGIFLPEDDPKMLMHVTLEQTAEALKKGIREATGLDLKIVRSNAATGKGFYLGDGFARRDGLPTDGLKDWANAYRVKDGRVYLYGARDWTTRPEQKWVWQNGVQPTIRATIRFMEDSLGARFMMPGWVGTEVPKRASIELKEGTVSTETPRLDFGAGCNRDMLHAYANECFGCGRYHSYGGHLYLPACPYDKYAKTHPEYFGVTKDGRYMCQVPAWRGWEPLCITNPDVEQLIIDELCRKFDAGSDVCELGQSDALLYCECENCLNYAGLRDDPGPYHGEQRWVFHRHIAERMMKERPGKIVHIISYAATENPPRTFHDFPPNVMVELCRYSEENLKRWKDWGTVPHGFTVYIYLWGEYHKVGLTPKHSMAFLAHEAHRFLEAGIHGIYRCGYGELWGLEGYAYYVFNRTLRHPEAKAEDLFSEYVNAMFGPAAKPMRAFYETIDARLAIREAEQVRQKVSDADAALEFVAKRPQSNIETIAGSWDKATLGKLEGLLAAAQATSGLSEKQMIRLKFVAAEFTYLRTIANVCHTYLAFQAGASEKTAKAAAAAVVRHRRFLDRVYGADGYPKPVPNWRHVALFGGNPRHILDRNGRNVGRIEEPLNWDVEKILSDYDVSGWRKKDKANRKLKRLTDWKLDSGFKAAKFECTKDGFHVVTDETNWNARIVAKYRDLVELKPGRKCRLSWYVRIPWQKPSAKTKWDGEASMRVWYGTGPKEDVAAPLVSYKLPSTDWVHQSLDFTLTGDPKTSTDVAFRLYYRLGDFWIKDITIEEVE